MKHIIFLFVVYLGSSVNLRAQCTPDSAFIADGELISPSPYQNDTLGDGLPSACLDMPYEVTLFVHPPTSFAFSGTEIPVTSFKIDSVLNLPPGITYSCSTDDCLFLADSISCIYLSGTPSGDDIDSVYDLSIRISISTLGLSIPVAFPDPTLAPGEYFINIKNNSSCETTPTADYAEPHSIAKVFPNPADDRIHLAIDSKIGSPGSLQIQSITGNLMKKEAVTIRPGSQEFDLYTGDLPVGLYLVGIQSNEGMQWSKFFKR